MLWGPTPRPPATDPPAEAEPAHSSTGWGPDEDPRAPNLLFRARSPEPGSSFSEWGGPYQAHRSQKELVGSQSPGATAGVQPSRVRAQSPLAPSQGPGPLGMGGGSPGAVARADPEQLLPLGPPGSEGRQRAVRARKDLCVRAHAPRLRPAFGESPRSVPKGPPRVGREGSVARGSGQALGAAPGRAPPRRRPRSSRFGKPAAVGAPGRVWLGRGDP